jgi:hypothetical protein
VDRCRLEPPTSAISEAIEGFPFRPDLQTRQTTASHDTIISPFVALLSCPNLHDPALLNRPVMPPRLPFGAPRTLPPLIPSRVRTLPIRRFASTAADAPEVYDVVCVGGGPAGLSLLSGLKASPVTSGLKVALIEGQDLQKNRLQKDAGVESFSNRCSSLTPASVKNLQGMSLKEDSSIYADLTIIQKSEHGSM